MSMWLVMKTSDGRERPFSIEKSLTVIGRETRCDVRIPVSAVSERHCEITNDDGELKLTDLDSINGTFHNGDRVEQAILTHNDELKIGPVTFVVRSVPGNTPQDAPTIEIERRDATQTPRE